MALALLATASLLACDVALPSESPPTPSPSGAPSGIRGTVLLGPTCPVQQDDEPCVTPYVARLAIVDANETEVAEVTSDANGRFEVALPPGTYLVVPEAGDPLPVAEPISVTVEAGTFVEVQINYDSGIR